MRIHLLFSLAKGVNVLSFFHKSSTKTWALASFLLCNLLVLILHHCSLHRDRSFLILGQEKIIDFLTLLYGRQSTNLQTAQFSEKKQLSCTNLYCYCACIIKLCKTRTACSRRGTLLTWNHAAVVWFADLSGVFGGSAICRQGWQSLLQETRSLRCPEAVWHHANHACRAHLP